MNSHRKVILITGGTQGLGLHLAKSFADAGSSVAICGRDQAALESASREVESRLHPDAGLVATRVDVVDHDALGTFFFRVEEELGPVDVTVSNAGIYGPIGELVATDPHLWAETISINLVGAMNVLRLSAESMIRRGVGRIIQLSGGGATKPMPRFTAYAASKAAVVRLVESLANELMEYKIPVNAVAPGALNTRMLEEVLSAGPDRAGSSFFEKSVDQASSGGAGFDRVTELIMFLAFDAPPEISGRLISAVWDDWQRTNLSKELAESIDRWTLRRLE